MVTGTIISDKTNNSRQKPIPVTTAGFRRAPMPRPLLFKAVISLCRFIKPKTTRVAIRAAPGVIWTITSGIFSRKNVRNSDSGSPESRTLSILSKKSMAI